MLCHSNNNHNKKDSDEKEMIKKMVNGSFFIFLLLLIYNFRHMINIKYIYIDVWIVVNLIFHIQLFILIVKLNTILNGRHFITHQDPLKKLREIEGDQEY